MTESSRSATHDGTHLVCSECQAVVRVPTDKLEQAPQCPQCHQPLFSGHPFELTLNAFEKHVQRSDLPVVIDVWAPWCGPCQMMAPHFEAVAKRMEPHARFAKLNSDHEPQLATRLNIRSIPTLIVFRGGNEIGRQSGAVDANGLTRWLQSIGVGA